MICTCMFQVKHGTYYSIVYSTYVHGINMYVHVYTRWVGFQMSHDQLSAHQQHQPQPATQCALRTGV